MTNFFLTDKNGTKHTVNEQQLQVLAAQGKITPATPLETDTGHTGLAGQIPGLNFKTAAPSPFAQPAQVVPPVGSCFCTNCGNPVSGQAVACMSCGAKPIGHRKFCRQCGVALKPEQVICVKCGAGIRETEELPPVKNFLGIDTKWSYVRRDAWAGGIIGCLCCLPLGLVALYFASQFEREFAAGHYDTAKRFGTVASILGTISIFILILIILPILMF